MAASDKESEEEINKKRGFVVKELLATEQTYVDNLEIVIKQFIDPIKDNQYLDEEDIKGQFLIWESLTCLHKELKKELDKELELKEIHEVRVGSIFKLFGAFFKMYKQYLSNFEPALTRRAELMCTNKEFETLIENARKMPECKGLDLEAYLVTPVQRIPRYRLLLQELLQRTPESHVDYTDLSFSLQQVHLPFSSLLKLLVIVNTCLFSANSLDDCQISEVAHLNNEAIREREGKYEIMQIMNKIDMRTRINLLDSPSRKLVRSAEMERQVVNLTS